MNRPTREQEAQADARRGGFSAHSVRLAWILAVAYLLVVVYASVQPFRGWRMPPDEILRFLTAPWPRYITLEDILVNIAAYVPLGFLLSIGCGARYGAALGALAAAFFAAGVSLSMEAVQMFLPSRIASNVDLLTNGLGALIGAMAAPLFAPSRPFGKGLHAWRHRLFKEGMLADVGFVITCLWIPTQLNPTTQLFGTGAMRAMFDLPVYAVHSPQLVLATEAIVVFLNLVGLGLTVAALMRPGARPMLITAVVAGAGLVLKTVAAALGKAAHPFVWLTPGISFGLLAGWLALYALVSVPRRVQLALAALCILAATVAINLAPDNPYQSIPRQFIAGGASHYLSFSAFARALSELWPLLAVAYLLSALFERRRT
ncbi:MAG TPA: VanZ family protein [Burkholderiales bacterium]|nr:VanZ family protein [Burkholderiales bacterium]